MQYADLKRAMVVDLYQSTCNTGQRVCSVEASRKPLLKVSWLTDVPISQQWKNCQLSITLMKSWKFGTGNLKNYLFEPEFYEQLYFKVPVP